jgi:hypothetical protein
LSVNDNLAERNGQAVRDILNRIVAGVAAGSVVLLAGACSGQKDDVASITGTDHSSAAVTPAVDGSSGLSKHVRAAEDLVVCLEREGIESTIEPWSVAGYKEEFQVVMPEFKSEDYAYSMPNAWGESSGSLVHMEIDEREPLLIDGDEDLTSVLEECMVSSGYSIPEPKFDPGDEETTKQQMAEVSNDWAECAREHGITGTIDAAVTVDNWESSPAATVPAGTDLTLFQDVLNDCSPLNPDRDLALGNMTDDGAEVLVDPQIESGAPPDSKEYADLRDALADHISGAYEQARGE